MDAQSVKTVEESAHISGFDAYKRVKGRKRHLLVDTLGIPLSYYVTPADMHDTQGARRLLGGLKLFVSRIGEEKVDPATGEKRSPAWRWVVERTFGWLSRNRRMSKDYERRVQTSETLIELAMMRLLLRRLGR
jgi:putative transposase